MTSEAKPLPEFLRLGRTTEDQALVLLSRESRRLLARNFRARGGELDLIFEEARPDGGLELVFVEVRARTQGAAWERGLESVGGRKRMRLEKAARVFLMRYRGRATTLRFDVAAFDGREWEIVERAW